MIRRIVARRSHAYPRSMPVRVRTLLMILAVLLMPFGMPMAGATPAHAQTPPAMSHCPDQGGKQRPGHDLITCSIVCAAALPSEPTPAPVAAPAAPAVSVLPSRMLDSVRPELATPPPRLT